MQKENVRWMNECARTGKGMDVIIVSTDSRAQEEECQRHLEGLLGDLIKPTAKVAAVWEDWPGGAGNGLGTLYAYLKGKAKLQERYGVDLIDLQKRGASIAIYHTAGQGKRLSPLTGSEHNNKSAVKLPAYTGKLKGWMTLLDAVLKQTALFAQNRKGRLSVFWGDQLFIPSKVLNAPPKHHAEIFVQSQKWPSKEEWITKKWSQYGVVSHNEDGDAFLFEKPDFTLIDLLKKEGKLHKKSAKSLGCFSLSTPLTFALLDLFQNELEQKLVRMDSDLSFWMPAILSKELYHKICGTQGDSEHFAKMQVFATAFKSNHPESPFFGALDIGAQSYWLDYGTLDQYFHNQLKLVEMTPEGETLRTFFGLKIDPETLSIVLNSSTQGSVFRRSIIVGTSCEKFSGEECILINSQIREGTGSHALLYNVHEKDPLELSNASIRADAFIEEQHIKLYTTLGRDGKDDWSLRLPQNALSYEDVYQLNQRCILAE